MSLSKWSWFGNLMGFHCKLRFIWQGESCEEASPRCFGRRGITAQGWKRKRRKRGRRKESAVAQALVEASWCAPALFGLALPCAQQAKQAHRSLAGLQTRTAVQTCGSEAVRGDSYSLLQTVTDNFSKLQFWHFIMTAGVCASDGKNWL